MPSQAFHHSLQPLHSLEALEAALAASAEKSVVIFKHSTTCGTSLMAAEEVADWLDGAAATVNADIFIVDVRRDRDVSQEIEARTRVRHESPQVLIVRNGSVVWHRSHAAVTAAAIERALA